MKQVRLIAPGRVELQDAPDSGTLGSHEVEVRISCVTVCGSDVRYFSAASLPHGLGYPVVLGHEASGTISRVGVAVAGHAVGERVAIEPQIWCGECAMCRSGRYHHCERGRFLASRGEPGALCELLRIDERCVHGIGEDISFEQGALLEPLSVAYSAVSKLDCDEGSRVAILGAGSIGLLAGCVMLRLHPKARVELFDLYPKKREIGQRLGLGGSLFRISGEYDEKELPSFTHVLETSGSADLLRSFLPHVAVGGRIVNVGVNEGPYPVTIRDIVYRDLEIHGSFRYAHTYPPLIAMVHEGWTSFDGIITDRFGPDDAQKAFEAAADTKSHAKVAIEFPA